MDEIDRLLVNRLQAGIPVAERPFAPIAGELGIPEAEVCGRLQRLLERLGFAIASPGLREELKVEPNELLMVREA